MGRFLFQQQWQGVVDTSGAAALWPPGSCSNSMANMLVRTTMVSICHAFVPSAAAALKYLQMQCLWPRTVSTRLVRFNTATHLPSRLVSLYLSYRTQFGAL